MGMRSRSAAILDVQRGLGRGAENRSLMASGGERRLELSVVLISAASVPLRPLFLTQRTTDLSAGPFAVSSRNLAMASASPHLPSSAADADALLTTTATATTAINGSNLSLPVRVLGDEFMEAFRSHRTVVAACASVCRRAR